MQVPETRVKGLRKKGKKNWEWYKKVRERECKDKGCQDRLRFLVSLRARTLGLIGKCFDSL